MSVLLTGGAQAGSVARLELAALVGAHAGDDSQLNAAWAAFGAGPEHAAAEPLAGALGRHAVRDDALRAALAEWLGRHAPPGAAPAGNAIGGGAQLWGTSLQAQAVHGSVHVHQSLPAPPPPPRPPVPRQVPPPPVHFVGRETDLAVLAERRAAHRSPAPQLIVVSGPAGVGKSALVFSWAGGLPEEFPGGRFYADLRAYGPPPGKPADPGEVLDGFLRTLGVPGVPADLGEKAALWRTLTADLPLLLVLESAFSAAQVRPLLPSGTGSLVVVTSRHQLTGLVLEGASLHQVSVLEQEAAVRLLDLGGGGPRVALEPEPAREVVALCACLPLAVCLAAAQLAARPRQRVAHLAAALARGQGPLDALRFEGQAAIRTALDGSFRLLAPEVAAAYRRLGQLPVDRCDRDLVAAVCASTADEADRVLDALVETNLLDDLGTGAYAFHDLVLAHARSQAEEAGPAGERETVVRRFVDWCLFTATAAEELLSPSHRTMARDYVHEPREPVPFAGADGALAWLAAHEASLKAAVRHCAAVRWDAACWQLADALWPAFLRLRPTEWWVEAHELGLAAARRTGDRRAESRMLTSGAAGLRNARQAATAITWYEKALGIARDDGDRRDEAQALNGLGVSHLLAGQYERAEHFLVLALAVREEIGYARGSALTRLALGEVALARKNYPAAAGHLTRAREALADLGDVYDAARALALLGHARGLAARAGSADGRPPGEGELMQALVEFESHGSDAWRARTLEMLGQAAERGGGEEDRAEARHRYEEALAILRPLSPADYARVRERLRKL